MYYILWKFTGIEKAAVIKPPYWVSAREAPIPKSAIGLIPNL